jgi:hypothetical protein
MVQSHSLWLGEGIRKYYQTDTAAGKRFEGAGGSCIFGRGRMLREELE